MAINYLNSAKQKLQNIDFYNIFWHLFAPEKLRLDHWLSPGSGSGPDRIRIRNTGKHMCCTDLICFHTAV
jgi:hypothetical protein